jgi:hypothetical protein
LISALDLSLFFEGKEKDITGDCFFC